jgi:hypothetical protein
MKKLTAMMFVTMFLTFSLCADQSNNEMHENFSKLGQSIPSNEESSSEDIDTMMKDLFGSGVRLKKRNPTTSYAISYQYTVDGWLQQVAEYEDSTIYTNMAGPRRGAQFIIADNGALMDMRNEFTEHRSYFSHKYTWAEIRTHENHQTVVFK